MIVVYCMLFFKSLCFNLERLVYSAFQLLVSLLVNGYENEMLQLAKRSERREEAQKALTQAEETGTEQSYYFTKGLLQSYNLIGFAIRDLLVVKNTDFISHINRFSRSKLGFIDVILSRKTVVTVSDSKTIRSHSCLMYSQWIVRMTFALMMFLLAA